MSKENIIKAYEKILNEAYDEVLAEATAPKLTPDQVEEVQKEMVKDGVPVRFMHGGRSINIETGEATTKGANVMFQMVYWNFTKETAKKIAKWLGVKPVFSK